MRPSDDQIVSLLCAAVVGMDAQYDDQKLMCRDLSKAEGSTLEELFVRYEIEKKGRLRMEFTIGCLAAMVRLGCPEKAMEIIDVCFPERVDGNNTGRTMLYDFVMKIVNDEVPEMKEWEVSKP